jgi:hypothetical protein
MTVLAESFARKRAPWRRRLVVGATVAVPVLALLPVQPAGAATTLCKQAAFVSQNFTNDVQYPIFLSNAGSLVSATWVYDLDSGAVNQTFNLVVDGESQSSGSSKWVLLTSDSGSSGTDTGWANILATC